VTRAWRAIPRNFSFWSPSFSIIRGRVRAASLARYLGSWRDRRVMRWLSAVKPALTSTACWELEAVRSASKSGATQASGTLCCLMLDLTALTWLTLESVEESDRSAVCRSVTCFSVILSAISSRERTRAVKRRQNCRMDVRDVRNLGWQNEINSETVGL
jgi:hypothetical protein